MLPLHKDISCYNFLLLQISLKYIRSTKGLLFRQNFIHKKVLFFHVVQFQRKTSKILNKIRCKSNNTFLSHQITSTARNAFESLLHLKVAYSRKRLFKYPLYPIYLKFFLQISCSESKLIIEIQTFYPRQSKLRLEM